MLLAFLLACNDTGAADLDELPTDSLKRIKETYKAFKAVSSSWAAAAAQGDAARLSQHAASGAVGAVMAWGPNVFNYRPS